MVFPWGILRRCFTEPHVMWFWLCFIVTYMSLKSGTLPFLRELWTNKAYLYFIKSAIFSILFSRNKWLVVVNCWLEVNYLKCFFSKFQKFFKMVTVLLLTPDFTSIYQMRIKNREIEKYIVLRRCLGT